MTGFRMEMLRVKLNKRITMACEATSIAHTITLRYIARRCVSHKVTNETSHLELRNQTSK